MDTIDVGGAVRSAIAVAGGFGIRCSRPAVLSDGANVVAHLRPAPVVVKVAATTTVVRPDVEAWLARELAVASFAAGRGAPVVRPSPELPATTHRHGGRVMSFWEYVAHDADRVADAGTAGSMLRDLHEVLRSYPGGSPRLAPLQDVERFLARPAEAGIVTADDRLALAAAFTRLSAALDPDGAAARPLHGDSGVGNLLATPDGWLWCDLEDTCSGPVAWDLAALTTSRRLDAGAVLRAYGAGVGPDRLATCEQLRRLHLTVWYALYAERIPRHRERAAELLASWR